jgi:pyridoxine kinase
MGKMRPMPVVLAISSQVASGHVGLAAILPALQRLGHEVIALPTVLLSNHPGHAAVAGCPVDAEALMGMLAALEANGRLAAIDAVLTGYLPSPDHVRMAAETVVALRVRRPDLLFVCDPVLGDDPKGLYIDRDAAEALRDELVPMADVITPNRFEWAWLGERRATAAPAIVTSAETTSTAVRSVLLAGDEAHAADVPFRTPVPNGTGDLLAALVTGHLAAGAGLVDAFARAVAGVHEVLTASIGADELRLVSTLDRAAHAAAAPVTRLAQPVGF